MFQLIRKQITKRVRAEILKDAEWLAANTLERGASFDEALQPLEPGMMLALRLCPVSQLRDHKRLAFGKRNETELGAGGIGIGYDAMCMGAPITPFVLAHSVSTLFDPFAYMVRSKLSEDGLREWAFAVMALATAPRTLLRPTFDMHQQFYMS